MHGHTSIITAKYVSCHYGHLNNGLLQNTSAVTDPWWDLGPKTQRHATKSELVSHANGVI